MALWHQNIRNELLNNDISTINSSQGCQECQKFGRPNWRPLSLVCWSAKITPKLNGIKKNFHKTVFLFEVAFRKCNSFFKSPKKNSSKLLSLAWNLNLLFNVIGGKSKFQVQDIFLKYFYFRDWEIWKDTSHFLKKSHL